MSLEEAMAYARTHAGRRLEELQSGGPGSAGEGAMGLDEAQVVDLLLAERCMASEPRAAL